MVKAAKLMTVTACVLAALPARAGDFVDTRLAFAFADDNVLAGPGETTPNSPTAGFGAGNQNTQFYDNFNTKFSGFESLSNLTLYKKSPSFFEGFTGEAALTVLLLVRPGGLIQLQDNSSYVRLNWRPPGWGEREGISITGFPVSADRFRLGYAYKISWGGTDIFTNTAAANGAPGVRLQLTRDNWYLYGGWKTALSPQRLPTGQVEQVRLHGFLAGGGVDIVPTLRFEVGVGGFQKGNVPGLADQGILAPVNAAGVSGQLVYHLGVPVGTSIDFRLYRNDPDIYEKFFAPEQYPGGLALTASLEGNFLTQTLEDPDTFAKTTAQNAAAVALQFRLKYNFMRIGFLGLYRTLSYIQFNVPGVPPFRDFPDGTKLQPEMFGAISFDYHIPRLHLTPGIIGGLQLPATFTSPSATLGGNNPPVGLLGSRTVVVRDVNQFSILPTNYAAEPIISAKFNLRFDISDYFAFVGEVYYTHDSNRTRFADSAGGISEPTFEKPDAIGFNTVLQARY